MPTRDRTKREGKTKFRRKKEGSVDIKDLKTGIQEEEVHRNVARRRCGQKEYVVQVVLCEDRFGSFPGRKISYSCKDENIKTETRQLMS